MTRFALRWPTSIDLVSRRGFLRAGGLALGGLTMADVLRLQAAAKSSPDARRKSVIMIFLSGGPSHLDMYDMKPQAPVEYRGEFSPIRTRVPGMHVSELMPMQAQIADKFAILRGFQGGHLHTANEFFSGYPWQESPRASIPGEAKRPALGSVVSRLRADRSPLPPYVSIRNQHQWERPYYLGHQHEPFRVAANTGGYRALDDMQPAPGVTPRRLQARGVLLDELDQHRRRLDAQASTAVDAFQRRALEMVSSANVRAAFDIEQESRQIRARYGEGLDSMGQDPWKWLLQARRLVEAGVSVVTACVYGWDTHRENFKTLRRLVPPLDRALHALVTDLDERGILDDVLILLGGEFGRTPRIGDQTPDGRSHWPEAGFLWIAGGPVQAGQAIGRTDDRGERVLTKPIKMQHVLVTLYEFLGIDPATTLRDYNGRPQYLLEDRQGVPGLT